MSSVQLLSEKKASIFYIDDRCSGCRGWGDDAVEDNDKFIDDDDALKIRKTIYLKKVGLTCTHDCCHMVGDEYVFAWEFHIGFGFVLKDLNI